MFRFFLLALLCLIQFYSFAQLPIDVKHYRIEVKLSDLSDVIESKARLTIQFPSTTSSFNLELVKSEGEEGMQVFSVMSGGKSLRFLHQQNTLRVDLVEPVKAGTQAEFEISYMGKPSDGLIISKNKFGDRTFFSDHWPDRAKHWIPVQHHPSDKATVEFIVTAPSHYEVVSGGRMISKKIIGGNSVTHWKQDHPIPVKVMALGVANFAVTQYSDSSIAKVSAWVYPKDSAALTYDYGVAPRVLKFFSNYIAPFPFKQLANVQSTTRFGGMENAEAIFYTEKEVSGKRLSEDLVAHEIAHQWFGNEASEKSYAHLWLSEGFATYFTDLYFEHTYGVDSARHRLREQRSSVIAYAKSSKKPVVDSSSDYLSLLNANSYEKGAWVLHMLRKELGDADFQKLVRAYFEKYKGGNASTEDLQALANTISGKDFKPFFQQWLYRPGIPKLKTKTEIEGSEVTVKIEQDGTPYNFLLDIGLVDNTGKMTVETVRVDKGDFKFKTTRAGVVKVVIDPTVSLLFSY